MNTFTKTIITFLLATLSVYAQHISGTILDEHDNPIEFANVILYNASSKQVITGAISNENGAYIFESLDNNSYYIEISSLGYKTKTSDVFTLENNSKTLHFKLEEDILDEVVIKATKPVIRQTAEKLIVNLENSNMVNNSIEDVIKKVPGIFLTNGNISYGGQGNIRILINGHTTDYMDTASLLKDFPAENIAKVELIEQPGSEYDAEGSGPILNIILKKNVKLGKHGKLRAVMGYQNEFRHNTSASIASYKNKLNWQASASYSKSAWRDNLYISRDVLDETYSQKSISPFDPINFYVGGRLDYYMNKHHTVGVNLKRIQNMSNRITNNITTIINTIGTETLLTDNSFDRERITYTVNPYYEYEKGKDKLIADFNFVNYDSDNENNLFEVGTSNVDYNNRRYFQDATFNILTYKADYKRTVNDNFIWSSGIKFSKVDSNSDLESLTEDDNGIFQINPLQSNSFLIDETILALYTKVNFKYKKWSFSGGLRWEDSDTKGFSTNTQETKTRNISKLFPSASVNRKLSDALGANFSYSYRIKRPSYSSLNSFVYYYDPYTFEEGNPNLKPAFTNSFKFSLTYENQPFFNINYRETTDNLFKLITQNDETAETSRTTINLAKNQNWGFSLFAPLSVINNLDGYVGVIANHNKYMSENLTPQLNLSKWSVTGFLNAEYELPWNINSEVSGYYTSGGLDGIIDYDWIAGIDLAFSKTFLNKRLKVTLEYEEILERKFYAQVNYDNVNAQITSDWARHNVFLLLNYSFGSKFDKNKKRKNSAQEEQDRIDNND